MLATYLLRRSALCCFCVLSFFAFRVHAQEAMTFERYNPKSTLVVPQHIVHKAKFPFIDIHNHQPDMSTLDLPALIKAMDTLNMKVMINLSGRNGEPLRKAIATVNARYPGRFILFANLDFTGFGSTEWTNKAVKQLEQDVKNGAKGLKIFKELGLTYKDDKGVRVPVDDPRLDAVWDKCGELHIPVLIHSAAPQSFWDPLDEKNERWLEMYLHNDRRYTGTNLPPWQQILDEQHRMFKKHPTTTFINAHFGWLANDLDKLSALMEELPNTYVEFGAVIAELGRQPKRARQFFEKYQDRILFGKDSWVPSEYDTYFRVLETEDEYFPYHKKYHAFWSMYGMGLPDAILKKIYYKNALKLLPFIDRSGFPD